jgi:uncharacterized membrane protein
MRRFARIALVTIGIWVSTPPAAAGELSDADVVALSQRHCVPCHARSPAHPAFDQPPRGIVLETIEEIRRHAAVIKEQVVEDRSMPLGNETDMTEEERAALGRFIDSLKLLQ